jgi:signal transduction histidine kinase
MRTSFATPDRVNANTLEKQIAYVSTHTLVNTLLEATNGIFAICNEFRQILSVNSSMLKLLGVDDPTSVLGFRPGEALNCLYSRCSEGGCGTSEYCRNCGLAISMVTSLESKLPQEKTCALTVNSVREKEDFYFKVKATPMVVAENDFLLISMQDITRLQHLQALEKVFQHDIANIATAIAGLTDYAQDCEPEDLPLLIQTLSNSARRLVDEIKLQRELSEKSAILNYQLNLESTNIEQVFDETIDCISGHPSLKGKKLRKPEIFPEKTFLTDRYLLEKVLHNMLINAFEATDAGRAVRFWIDSGKHQVTFCVWNHKPINEAVRSRIFQRNYTTKNEAGHGQGTFSMKHFGEQLLGGKIAFETSATKGTVFRFSLPTHQE